MSNVKRERDLRKEKEEPGYVIAYKAAACAFISTCALLSRAVIPTPEAIDQITGTSENPLFHLVAKLRLCIPFGGFLGGALVVGMWFLYKYYFDAKKRNEIPKSKAFLGLSILFAVITVCGMSVQAFDSLAFIVGSPFQMCYSAFVTLGYALFFHMLCGLALRAAERRDICRFRIPTGKWIGPLAEILLDKYPVLVPFGFLIVCWLPYWIVHFPGTMCYDMTWALGGYFGAWPWSDHHPVFSSLLYGGLVSLGRRLGGENVAAWLCALFQHLLFAGTITYGIYSLKRWGLSQRFRLFTLFFFAFCPIVAYWPQAVLKDCAFAAFDLWFSVALLNLILKIRKAEPCIRLLIVTVISGVVMALTRHNGLYIIAVSLPLLALPKSSRRVKMSLITASLIMMAAVLLTSSVLCTLVGARKGSVAEALSIPFQQTARYVRDHANEVTPEERQVIDSVLIYDRLGEIYCSERSDAVKDGFRKDGSDHLGEYMAVWLKMFFKHPITYLEATLSGSYTYFTPDGSLPVSREYIFNSSVNVGNWSEFSHLSPADARMMFESGLHVVRQIPGIGLLCCLGTYSWVLFALIACGIYKRKGYLIIGCVPTMMNLLCCIASPVNGLLRYFLPNVLMTPILIGWFLAELSGQPEVKKETKTIQA